MDGADLTGGESIERWAVVEFVNLENVTSQERVVNLRANAGRALPSVDFKRICICASGPSLADHVEDIRARQNAGWHVATMNGSHNFLIERGIVPDLFFMVDARPVNLPFLRLANDHTTYIIASQCDPEIFDALEGRKVVLWQMFHDDEGLAAIRERAPASCKFFGSFNVGQSCLNPIVAMGYRVWHLFGYDASVREEKRHAFDQPQNDGEEIHTLEYAGKTYRATGTMAHHASTFPERVALFKRLGMDIELHCEGLLPDMVADMVKPLAAVGHQAEKPGEPLGVPAIVNSRAAGKLPIVTFKWQGHISYFARDVNIWGAMVDRHLRREHELVLITDDATGVDGAFRTVPLWRDQYEHGRDWHRLKLFAEEMADTIGPEFVCMDLDVVICGELDSLFDHGAPFKAWADPFRPRQYCTSVFQLKPGAFPHVWNDFDPAKAMELRRSGKWGGYDQGWISEVLPNQPVWTPRDGVLSFKRHVMRADEIEHAVPSAKQLPAGARIINFHGKFNPRDEAVQAAFPWVAEHWR